MCREGLLSHPQNFCCIISGTRKHKEVHWWLWNAVANLWLLNTFEKHTCLSILKLSCPLQNDKIVEVARDKISNCEGFKCPPYLDRCMNTCLCPCVYTHTTCTHSLLLLEFLLSILSLNGISGLNWLLEKDLSFFLMKRLVRCSPVPFCLHGNTERLHFLASFVVRLHG